MRIVLAFLGLCLACPALAQDTLPPSPPEAPQQASPFPFRQARWGMSPEEVRRSEPEAPTEEEWVYGDLALVYEGEVSGLPVEVLYVFAGGERLDQAVYTFTSAHEEGHAYLEDSHHIGLEMERAYGPAEVLERWEAEDHRHDPSRWGDALLLGHFERVARWETPDSLVGLFLSLDSHGPFLRAVYGPLSETP